MKKLLSLLVSASLMCGAACMPAIAEEAAADEENQAAVEEAVEEELHGMDLWNEIAGEDGTTYTNLFDVILKDDYYQYWYDYIATIVGEDQAAPTVDGLQASISSELYGQDAIDFYDANPDAGMAFDCFYIGDIDSFTFEGNTVTANYLDGTSETHEYEYLGQYSIGEGETMTYMGAEFPVEFGCDVFGSTDEAGELNYFFMCADTMATTYHLEFRYGASIEDLQGYFVGPYAYWLAAGIDAEADEATIEDVIALFCLENMGYDAHTEGALDQLAELGFVGTWQADLSEFGDEYEGVELVVSIDEQGHGVTTMNGMQTADFEAYAYDNGEPGDGAGIYVAYSNYEFEAEAAPYTMLPNDDGNMVMTFFSDEGAISYVEVDEAA